MRTHTPHLFQLSLNTHDITENLQWWKEEAFDGNNNKPTLSSTLTKDSFSSCTFIELSSDNDGGAIYYTSGSSIHLDHCTFTHCKTTGGFTHSHGGGAVYISRGTLSIINSSFLLCTTSSFGGGIYAYTGCASSYISQSTFISCKGTYGGGVNIYCGPTSSVLSSRFISCTGSISGGGFYHDSHSGTSAISVSDSFFIHNCADSASDGYASRGGGGFENFRSATYPTNYSFLFFHGNIAKKGIGHDITSNANAVSEGSVVHCFTTTAENSFCNAGRDQKNWLPLTTVNLLLTSSAILTRYVY